ncbi:hypothetical protein KAR91_70165 [Candidatus Pacearchaeota archaeon]|nr:hypothetical protein [Candidatus Pacearchaeota archaeon]
MPVLEPAVIINVIGENTGAASQDESTWHTNYFPSMYDNTWYPGGPNGFMIGHRPTPGDEAVAQSYLFVNVGEIGGWEITSEKIWKGNVHIKSDAELIQLGTVTDFLLSGTDSGVLMGKGATYYEFFAGKEDGNYIHWDGTALNVSGNISADTGEIGGWFVSANTLASSATEANAGISLNSSIPEIRVGDSAGAHIVINGADSAAPYIASSNHSSDPLTPRGFKFNFNGEIEAVDGTYLGKLQSNVFVQNEVNIVNGDLVLTSGAKLFSNLASSVTSMVVDQQIFNSGDIVQIGTPSTNTEKILVTNGGTGTGPYTYTITRGYEGSSTNAYNGNQVVYKVADQNSTHAWISIQGSAQQILFTQTVDSGGTVTSNDRLLLGEIGTNQYGLKGWNSNNDLVFEIGELNNLVGGWTMGTSGLTKQSAGTGFSLNAGTSEVLTVAGFEIVNPINPRAFLGNATSYINWNDHSIGTGVANGMYLHGDFESDAIITGGTFQTAATGQRVVINGAANSMVFYTASAQAVEIDDNISGSQAGIKITDGMVYMVNTIHTAESSWTRLGMTINIQEPVTGSDYAIKGITTNLGSKTFGGGVSGQVGSPVLNPTGSGNWAGVSGYVRAISGADSFNQMGLHGNAYNDRNSSTKAYGVYAIGTKTTGTGDSYGIYATAINNGTGTAYAGYFNGGDVYIENDLAVNGTIQGLRTVYQVNWGTSGPDSTYLNVGDSLMTATRGFRMPRSGSIVSFNMFVTMGIHDSGTLYFYLVKNGTDVMTLSFTGTTTGDQEQHILQAVGVDTVVAGDVISVRQVDNGGGDLTWANAVGFFEVEA